MFTFFWSSAIGSISIFSAINCTFTANFIENIVTFAHSTRNRFVGHFRSRCRAISDARMTPIATNYDANLLINIIFLRRKLKVVRAGWGRGWKR